MLKRIISKLNLTEPSSYSAFAAVLVGAGIQIPDGLLQHASLILAGVCGLVGWLAKETQNKEVKTNG